MNVIIPLILDTVKEKNMNILKIKDLMIKSNISQYKLAKLTGLSTGNISMLLSGKLKEPTLRTAKLIARALDVTIDEITL